MISKIDVFNRIVNDLQDEYPNIKVYSKRTLEVESLPCVWADEIDSYDVSSRSLDNLDETRVSQFEIQVFSEKLDDLYKITRICKRSMKNMCYQCSMSQDIDNENIAIQRHVMRFNRVIGGNDNI